MIRLRACRELPCSRAVAIAGCARASGRSADAELPTLDVTSWTDKTELFMEYPPLVAGRPALFAIHLTKLADFTAVSAGRASLEFTTESGGPQRLTGPSPSRPGVFRVEEPPPMAGRYRWALVLEAPDCPIATTSAPSPCLQTSAARSRAQAVEPRIPRRSPISRSSSGPIPSRRTSSPRRRCEPQYAHPRQSTPCQAAKRSSRLPPQGVFVPIVALDWRSRQARADAGVPGAASRRRCRPRHPGGRRRRRRRPRTMLLSANRPGRSDCSTEQAVPARRVEDARRATTVAEAGCGPRKHASAA